MTKEKEFLQYAIAISDGKIGNFEFDCPFCGGYAIGNRKIEPENHIQASCNTCKLYVRSKLLKKIA